MDHTLAEFAAMDIPDVFKALDSEERGLSDHEAKLRLKRIGPNMLVAKQKRPILIEFFDNFLDPLVITLMVIAIISFAMGSNVDGVLILIMVVMSVTLNFFQEYKAGKAAEALQAKVAHIVEVYRNSRLIELPAAKILPGDIVELNAGDLIPADARIVEAKDFFVNQSSLTGESFPIEKTAMTLSKKPSDLSQMYSIALSGTAVHTGWAKVVVLKTGCRSEFGKLAGAIKEISGDDEFSCALHGFSKMIIKLIVILVTFIFGFKAIIYHDIWNSLQFAVAVAVGLTPEFLPMIMSVTMGKGSVQMAKKGVIVKKLTAIPTIGSMNILCTDKTGTLTENKIAVVKYIDLFGDVSNETLKYAYLNSNFQSGITNPMDDAVKNYKHLSSADYQKIDEIPFDFDRKKLTVVLSHEDEGVMITKGAPESMLPAVDTYWYQNQPHTFTQDAKKRYQDLYHQLSLDGFRVIAVATKKVDQDKHPFQKNEETKMSFSGFVAFLDPAKKGVRNALDELELLGIELKVITGDNELVAQKICGDVGVVVKGVMLGSEADEIDDEHLGKMAQKTTIFARFAPAQKNRVIRLLRQHDNVVGYLGDGINDAPSLTTADVGISVANAVDVAREAADLVLTHKSLHELAEGVKEGRKTFGNTMKYIMMGLSSNFGNMFSMLGAVVFLPFLPMLPLQILLNNFIYDFTQVTIPTDTVDEEYIRKPKRLRLPDIHKFMMLFGPISSVFDFLTFGVLYFFYSKSPAQFQTGWFIESLATQTLVIHVIRTRLKPFIESRASLVLTLTTVAGVVMGWWLPISPIARYFGFKPIGLDVSLILILIITCYLFTVEFGKRWYYRRLTNGI